MTDTGSLLDVSASPRGHNFDPQLIPKYQRRFPGFDEKIVSMYARGMSTREITGHLQELYGIEVSPDLISTVTDAVLDEVAAWQQRRSMRFTRLSFSMRSASRSATKAWSATRRSISPWASARMAARRFSACG